MKRQIKSYNITLSTTIFFKNNTISVKKILLTSWVFLITFFAPAQKRVAEYPVVLKTGGTPFGGGIDIKSCFLKDTGNENFMLLLMENKNIEYLLFDKNKKLQSHFSLPNEFKHTYFTQRDNEYLGGNAGNDKYYFVFKVRAVKGFGFNTKYELLVVDPIKKTATTEDLFDIPKKEKLIVSFGNFNQYFSLFADNETEELKLYGLNASGEKIIKSIPLAFPENGKKKKLSDHLQGMQVITQNEETGLESATGKVKLFHSPEELSILINQKNEPSRIITINTQTFTKTEIEIDHSPLFNEEKDSPYLNSFLFNNSLFTLTIGKNNIKLAVYDLVSKQLLQTHEINQNTDLGTFAATPIEISRKGKRDKEKNIDDIKKLVKALDKGSEAILVNKDKKGKLVVTVGTYDLVAHGSSGGGGFSSSTRYVGSSYSGPNATSTSNYGSGFLTERTYTPGTSSLSYDANYYKSTHFKLLLDSATFKTVKGRAASSVAEQIKDYLSEVDKKAQALNQFNISGKQYLGYYIRSEKAYIIEEIFIRK